MSAPSPSSPSSSPPSDIPSFESLDDQTQSAYHAANVGDFAPALSLVHSGVDIVHSFCVPKALKMPEGNIVATSFLYVAVSQRDLSMAKELLSFWSPEKHPDDPLLPLAANTLLNSSTDTTSSEDVEFCRLLLDYGLDLNCDASPDSPLA